LSKAVIESKYAVRGKIPARGEQIQKELNEGKGNQFAFDKTTPLNIGNPQTVGQGTITFNREVLSGMLYPELCNKDVFSKDAVNRI
jgi:alanine transaminase